jgi:hypothetical protein
MVVVWKLRGGSVAVVVNKTPASDDDNDDDDVWKRSRNHEYLH